MQLVYSSTFQVVQKLMITIYISVHLLVQFWPTQEQIEKILEIELIQHLMNYLFDRIN